jgi:hypothetical protein
MECKQGQNSRQGLGRPYLTLGDEGDGVIRSRSDQAGRGAGMEYGDVIGARARGGGGMGRQ